VVFLGTVTDIEEEVVVVPATTDAAVETSNRSLPSKNSNAVVQKPDAAAVNAVTPRKSVTRPADSYKKILKVTLWARGSNRDTNLLRKPPFHLREYVAQSPLLIRTMS
jgi:hypothetical protein